MDTLIYELVGFYVGTCTVFFDRCGLLTICIYEKQLRIKKFDLEQLSLLQMKSTTQQKLIIYRLNGNSKWELY